MDQLGGLTEEARKLALDRFRLLQPHLEDDRPLKAVAAAVLEVRRRVSNRMPWNGKIEWREAIRTELRQSASLITIVVEILTHDLRRAERDS